MQGRFCRSDAQGPRAVSHPHVIPHSHLLLPIQMRSIRALEGDNNNNKEVYSKIEARPMDKCESQTHQRKAVAGARTTVETTCREEREMRWA